MVMINFPGKRTWSGLTSGIMHITEQFVAPLARTFKETRIEREALVSAAFVYLLLSRNFGVRSSYIFIFNGMIQSCPGKLLAFRIMERTSFFSITNLPFSQPNVHLA
jgi:hypothetical protein